MLLISKKKVLAELEERMRFYENLYKDYKELANDPESDDYKKSLFQRQAELNEASYWSLRIAYLNIKKCM